MGGVYKIGQSIWYGCSRLCKWIQIFFSNTL